MATRSGDVDASLVYYIQEREGLSNEEMLNILNKSPVCLVFRQFQVICVTC